MATTFAPLRRRCSELLQGLPDDSRIFAHTDAVLAAGELVIAHEIHQPAARAARWFPVRRAVQPAARDEHVADARGEDDGAERREIEEPEAGEARVLQRAVGHEIRRRCRRA